VSSAIDQPTIDAVGQAVAGRIVDSVQKPFADVLAKIGALQGQVAGLQAATQALTRDLGVLQVAHAATAGRVDELHARAEGVANQLAELSDVVGGMGVELDVVEAVALDQGVEEPPPGGDRPPRPAPPKRKSPSSHNK
jgi:hypothetical protein